MDFAQVETKYKGLKREYDAGAITEDEFKAKLEELMIEDEEGRWWIIGYETGQWYYHDGEKWVQAEPPKPTTPAGEPQRILNLFQQESFLLHFLPTVVAAGIFTLVGSYYLDLRLRLPNFFLGAVITFVLWLILYQKVIHRWLMMLVLAGGWMLIGVMEDFLFYGFYWNLMIVFVLNTSAIFALGYGLSFIFPMLLRARPASKQ